MTIKTLIAATLLALVLASPAVAQDASASASASALASATTPTLAAEDQYSAPASPAPVVPETGGASLAALGAGILLVAGGLLARRMVR